MRKLFTRKKNNRQNKQQTRPIVGCPVNEFCRFGLTEEHTTIFDMIERGEQASSAY